MLHLLRVIILRARRDARRASRPGAAARWTHEASGWQPILYRNGPPGGARPRALKCGHLSPIHFCRCSTHHATKSANSSSKPAQAPRVRGADAARDHGPGLDHRTPRIPWRPGKPGSHDGRIRGGKGAHQPVPAPVDARPSPSSCPSTTRPASAAPIRSWSRAARPPRRPRNHGMPGPVVWEAQRLGKPLDSDSYVELIRQRAER